MHAQYVSTCTGHKLTYDAAEGEAQRRQNKHRLEEDGVPRANKLGQLCLQFTCPCTKKLFEKRVKGSNRAEIWNRLSTWKEKHVAFCEDAEKDAKGPPAFDRTSVHRAYRDLIEYQRA